LRSPYAMVGRLVYFGRMLDKIRLHAAGQLPAEYVPNLGDEDNPLVFDARACLFLGIKYDQLRERTQQGGTDEVVLHWAEKAGFPRSDSDCHMWNQFMMKIGWRDERAASLQQRVVKFGFAGRGVETGFDFLEIDEGRDPVAARPWELPAPVKPSRQAAVGVTAILLMGVAGSGKTTIGVKLAHALGWSFRDADEFHPPENVAKMAAGIPLDDVDRAPWLQAIRDYIARSGAEGNHAVVTCSALKEKYRKVLIADPTQVKLVYLKGDFELILRRISDREGHFMKPEMLRSQFEALERPAGAFEVDVALEPDEIVRRIRTELGV
jgi:carbohydrate kinase (thermoresistant glucokinase family)